MPEHPQFTLRAAIPHDAEALAALHVAVWRATYRDYATPEALEKLDEARRLPGWSQAIAEQRENAGVRIAEAAGSPVGLICFGPSEQEAFGGRIEIKHLYVSNAAQGQGVGRALLSSVLQDGLAHNWPGLALAVVRENQAARQFYQRLGGKEVGRFTDPGPLWKSDNVVVAWDTVPKA